VGIFITTALLEVAVHRVVFDAVGEHGRHLGALRERGIRGGLPHRALEEPVLDHVADAVGVLDARPVDGREPAIVLEQVAHAILAGRRAREHALGVGGCHLGHAAEDLHLRGRRHGVAGLRQLGERRAHLPHHGIVVDGLQLGHQALSRRLPQRFLVQVRLAGGPAPVLHGREPVGERRPEQRVVALEAVPGGVRRQPRQPGLHGMGGQYALLQHQVQKPIAVGRCK
jgi:hypothetical protein